jgi:hypothetical protein
MVELNKLGRKIKLMGKNKNSEKNKNKMIIFFFIFYNHFLRSSSSKSSK